ncbi:MAG TPA: hypothetical protein VMU01_08005 [Rhizomicrobium sp.]|nr:hypothetical protein [Rhizomicrobium sp.]
MNRIRFAAVLLALGAAPALADLPPPADDYVGPRHVTVAGLAFEHRLTHYSRVIDHANNPSFVLLVGCEGESHNCNAVKRAGVIDWEVIAVGGKPIARGDLNALVAAFGSGHGPVEVLFASRVPAQPPRTFALMLDRQ